MFTVYTKSNCAYCRMAKNLLDKQQVKYEEVSLDNPAFLSKFKEMFPNVRTVPLIINEDNVIGGYNDLRKYLNG